MSVLPIKVNLWTILPPRMRLSHRIPARILFDTFSTVGFLSRTGQTSLEFTTVPPTTTQDSSTNAVSPYPARRNGITVAQYETQDD